MQNGCLRLVTCPSDPRRKGTKYIVDAVNSIGDGIELVIVTGKDHDTVLDALKSADVVIDNVIVQWYGMVTLEAWSFKKPVLCSIDYQLQKLYSVPVINTQLNNIEVTIKACMRNKDILKTWGQLGYDYLHKVHDVRQYKLYGIDTLK